MAKPAKRKGRGDVQITDPVVIAALEKLVKDGELGSGKQKFKVLGQPGEKVWILGAPHRAEDAELYDNLQDSTEKLFALIEKHNVAVEVQDAISTVIRSFMAIAEYHAKINKDNVAMAGELPKLVKSLEAKEKAKKRHASDPKRAAKQGALELWEERRAGKHPKLRTTEQFAIEVMRRWPILESAKVICKWSADWNRATKEGRTPSC